MRANSNAGGRQRLGGVSLHLLVAMAATLAAIFASSLPEPEWAERPGVIGCSECNDVPTLNEPSSNGLLGMPASASDLYAAIAYSKEANRWGYGFNFLTLQEAKNRAIDRCGDVNCRVVVWVRNGCCALAVGDGGQHGWSYRYGDYARSEAMNRSLTECSSRTTNCRVVAWTCSDR